MKSNFLYPCTMVTCAEPTAVTTILGSCVALCLHDPKKGIGGINHYMLPLWNGQGLASAKYGNIAIKMLLKQMLAQDCKKKDLIAKLFGGANQSNSRFKIGEQNIEIAREMLKDQGIRIVSENSGGINGRKMIFETHTGKVSMKFIQSKS